MRPRAAISGRAPARTVTPVRTATPGRAPARTATPVRTATPGRTPVRPASWARTGWPRTACLSAILAATLAAAGCGGASPSDKVTAAIKAFGRAVSAGDGATACAQMEPGFEPLATCERTVALDGKRLTAQQKALFRNLTVKSVKISGTNATAVVLYGTQVQHPRLKLYSGHWRLIESVQL